MTQNQELTEEKARIMDVNKMLEKRIQVERSEMQSVRNDFEHYARFDDQRS